MSSFVSDDKACEVHGHYLVSLQAATAVSHCVTCSFTGKGVLNLVLARINSLEIYDISEDGGDMTLNQKLPINGRISTLNVINNTNTTNTTTTTTTTTSTTTTSTTDTIMFTTDRCKAATLRYNTDTKQVETISSADFNEQIGAESEKGHFAIVSEEHNLAVFHMYAGYLKIAPFTTSGTSRHLDLSPSGPSYNARLDEPDGVLSVQFIPGSSVPAVAV
eukprot:CAMPEP_0182467574 /NCGR_PEP_ID=MMETSP1319-20130603/14170_1 /TAXON_ID=172717 /ORGANISM="Bolidomonas pacifica, Strain RCC208" /LENGTH=218 /DNA_ID=CAMNT_0024667675 /DNA_START=32 /DNA_END=684 /DNA_ORIENTATION=-